MDNPSVTAGNLSGAAGGVGTIFGLIGNMMNARSASQQGTNIRAANEFEAQHAAVIGPDEPLHGHLQRIPVQGPDVRCGGWSELNH